MRRLIPNPTIKKDFAALLAGQSPDRRKLAQVRLWQRRAGNRCGLCCAFALSRCYCPAGPAGPALLPPRQQACEPGHPTNVPRPLPPPPPQLVDLLERMMQLDPDKRITPKDALRHPFIKEPPSAAGK